jgi:hypothetical protein
MQVIGESLDVSRPIDEPPSGHEVGETETGSIDVQDARTGAAGNAVVGVRLQPGTRQAMKGEYGSAARFAAFTPRQAPTVRKCDDAGDDTLHEREYYTRALPGAAL